MIAEYGTNTKHLNFLFLNHGKSIILEEKKKDFFSIFLKFIVKFYNCGQSMSNYGEKNNYFLYISDVYKFIE